MNYLLYILVPIFVIVCLFLIGVVLLQTGKSAALDPCQGRSKSRPVWRSKRQPFGGQ